jgi:hypothetical protein
MAEADITRIEKHGEAYRVQGVHEGRKADMMVPAQTFEEVRRAEGEQGLQQYLRRQLPHCREDIRYDLEP